MWKWENYSVNSASKDTVTVITESRMSQNDGASPPASIRLPLSLQTRKNTFAVHAGVINERSVDWARLLWCDPALISSDLIEADWSLFKLRVWGAAAVL